ncbi:MAG: hypothetical protein LBG43_11505 [Treponema sp.]|nr:hypothetical protein [Treponema sp.]
MGRRKARRRAAWNRPETPESGRRETAEELRTCPVKQRRELCESVQRGWRKPAPVRRVESIPDLPTQSL